MTLAQQLRDQEEDTPIQVLIADDHEITRRGLKEIIQDEFNCRRLGEARNFSEAIDMVQTHPWDILLLDVIMPDGNVFDVIPLIQKIRPELPILILTAIAEHAYITKTLKAGASGFINKREASNDLVMAIRRVLDGQVYLNGSSITHVAQALRSQPTSLLHHKLSQRELEVFKLIAEGLTVKEAGIQLGVSSKTINTYIARIRAKTSLASHVEITRYALHHGLVK